MFSEYKELTIDQIIDQLMEQPEGTRMQILAPVIRARKGEYQKVFEDARKESDFGNGRFVRNILENAKMNQASRLLEYDFDAITTEEIKTIKAVDITPPPEIKQEAKRTIGFVY